MRILISLAVYNPAQLDLVTAKEAWSHKHTVTLAYRAFDHESCTSFQKAAQLYDIIIYDDVDDCVDALMHKPKYINKCVKLVETGWWLMYRPLTVAQHSAYDINRMFWWMDTVKLTASSTVRSTKVRAGMVSYALTFVFLVLCLCTHAVSLTTTAKDNTGTYRVLSVGGIRQYTAEVIDASRYKDLGRIQAVNAKYGVKESFDGSLVFPIGADAIVNTVPRTRKAVEMMVVNAGRALDLAAGVNPNPGSYEVTSECRNSLMWLRLALNARQAQVSQPLEINPNPEAYLPKDWLTQIKPAKIEGNLPMPPLPPLPGK